MFPEYRDVISKLKTTDAHFAKVFDKHNELDEKIINLENDLGCYLTLYEILKASNMEISAEQQR